MLNGYKPLKLKVWGDFACFTRPEMKVERVSYPLMTPSAARGVLEAVFWKPQFRWRIEEIAVLKPVRYFSILRNEVNNRASERSARGWQKAGGGYDATADRSQRHTLALRDVGYVITASVDVNAGVGEDAAKFRDQFRRRAQRGQCFATPYLGCREFAAYFAEPDGTERPAEEWSEDLGPMLLDLDFDEKGSAAPLFFDARVEGGILVVPQQGGE
ncbi:MAG: type I-C CRISPR-associated protein Cas5c [Dehalococcoidia bacterium]